MSESAPIVIRDGADVSGSGDLPRLSSDGELDAALEALLLVVDSPVGEGVLASAVDQPVQRHDHDRVGDGVETERPSSEDPAAMCM